MSPNHHHNTHRHQNGSTTRVQRTASAFGARGGFAASQKAIKLGTSTPSKANERKQRKTELTGKEIVEKWKGGRLANLVDILGSHSRQIVVLIEKKANSMLDLFLEIGERKTSLTRFDIKVKNKQGEEEPFTPSCCRLKNPVTGSQIVQDLDEFKTIVSKYQDLVNDHKKNARNLLLQAAKLEVKAREDKLQGEALDTLIKITTNLVIEEYVRDKSSNLTHNYNENELAFKIARHYIGSINDNAHKNLYFDSNTKCKEAIDKIINNESTNTSDFNATASEDDKRVATKIKATLTELFPKLTTDLWSAAKERDLLRQINAEQALFNEKKSIETATEEATDLIAKDPIIPQSQLKAAVSAMFKKELHASKAQARKKSSADSKNQGSNATKNGQKPNKSSKRKREDSLKQSVASHKSVKKQKSNHRSNIKNSPQHPNNRKAGGRMGDRRQNNQGRGGRGDARSAGRGRC
jgi:hypothetical protein